MPATAGNASGRLFFLDDQWATSYVVLQMERPVFRGKGTAKPIMAQALPNVLDNSLADVSLLAGLLVDKFQYHLPLYRQHQRLQQAGITVSRSTLTWYPSSMLSFGSSHTDCPWWRLGISVGNLEASM